MLDVSGQDAQISEAALRRVATRCPTLREIKLGACPSVRAFSSCMARVLSLCPTMRVLHLCAVPFERSIVGRAVGLEGVRQCIESSTRTSKEDAPADDVRLASWWPVACIRRRLALGGRDAVVGSAANQCGSW